MNGSMGPISEPKQPERPALSIFFPCYNDGGTIGSIVALADETARGLTDSYEIIVVDDGSSDHSRLILRSLEPKYPHLRLIFHDGNRGYGGALRSGFAAARGEWVFYTDGDYQYDVDDLRLLWAKACPVFDPEAETRRERSPSAGPEVDVVNGFKIRRRDPIYRVWIGLIYQYAMQFLFWLKIRDVDCDFRLIRRSALEKFRLLEDTGCICVELVKKLQETGARFEEAGVKHMFRAYGYSQFFNLRRIFRTLVSLSRLWVKLMVRREYDLAAGAEMRESDK